jgi:hypothetical protein
MSKRACAQAVYMTNVFFYLVRRVGNSAKQTQLIQWRHKEGNKNDERTRAGAVPPLFFQVTF